MQFRKYRNHIFLICIFIFIIIINIHRLYEPSFWDETKVYIRPLYLMNNDFLEYFKLSINKVQRPPGLNFMYLPFIKIFGPSMITIRITSLVFYLTSIAFLFLVFVKDQEDSAKATIIYILTIPVIFVYSLHIVAEPQILLLFSIIFWLLFNTKKNIIYIFAIGLFAGLTRENALALIPVIFYSLWEDRKFLKYRYLLVAISPAIGIAIHLLINHIVSGQFIHHVVLTDNHISVANTLSKRWHLLLKDFIFPYKLTLLLPVSFFFGIAFRTKEISKLQKSIIILIATYILTYSSFKEYASLPRYYYSIAPFFIYLLISLIIKNVKWKKVSVAIVITSAILLGQPNDNKNIFHYKNTGMQDGLEYTKIIDFHTEVIRFVKLHARDEDLIISIWPYTHLLTLDNLGYGKPVTAQVIEYFIDMDRVPKIILWHPYFEERLPRYQLDKLLAIHEYTEKIIRVNNRYIYIYILSEVVNDNQR